MWCVWLFVRTHCYKEFIQAVDSSSRYMEFLLKRSRDLTGIVHQKKNINGTNSQKLPPISCGVLCAGPGGQRCSSRAGGYGSSTKEDRTSVGRRLAVWSRPVSLLRRHFSTRQWVDAYWAQSKFLPPITTTNLYCQINSMTLILRDISKSTRYAPRPHTLGGHQLGQCVRLRSGGAWRGLGAYV